MARRRTLTSTPLLVATGSLAMGCGFAIGPGGGGSVVGNLVAPPGHELCVTVDPADAAVQIDGIDLEDDGCSSVYEGSHEVSASAEGYVTHTETVDVLEDTTLDITLAEDTGA